MNLTMETTDAPGGNDTAQDKGEVGQNDALRLSERAYAAIEQRIATCVFAPGMVLSEKELSKELGIGRTPIREALQRLALDGMVDILPRRGVLVSSLDVRTHLRLLEVRREVERLVARSAAARATEQERQAFSALVESMQDAARNDDEERFMQLDQDLNALLQQAARNEFATKAIGFMSGLSRRFWFMHRQRDARDLNAVVEHHIGLAKAIASGDPDLAGWASDALMDYVESFTRAAMDW